MTTDDVPLVDPEVDQNFETVLGWADELRRLGVRTNADTPEDAKRAREFGAEGIGLCRTEHMFMAADRQPKMRAVIVADSDEERKEALAELLPLQQEDFEGLFEEMQGLPVTIRLLDPPLHEFLPVPHELEEGSPERRRAEELQETNPMLGTRGVRLGILHPEISEMQVAAMVRAAKAVQERCGTAPELEIMVPLVAYEKELAFMREVIERAVAGQRRRRPGAEDRHDAGAAPRLLPGRRDRRGGRLLLVRHQRPDPDGAGVLTRRRGGQVPGPLPGAEDHRPQPVRDPGHARRRASWCGWGRGWAARATRSWAWASAASTGATPSRSTSSTTPAWTT